MGFRYLPVASRAAAPVMGQASAPPPRPGVRAGSEMDEALRIAERTDANLAALSRLMGPGKAAEALVQAVENVERKAAREAVRLRSAASQR